MFQTKVGNTDLCVVVAKKAPDVVVALTIPLEGVAPCCLGKLLCNSGLASAPAPMMKGGDDAALAFALFETIRDKLIGTPLDAARSRVGNVSCKSFYGSFTVYWNVQGTGSALRKSMSLALSCLAPHKLASKYVENVRALSGRNGVREHFNYCAKKMITAIKKNVHVFAVGKINTNEEKVTDLFKIAVARLPDMLAPSDKDSKAPVIAADAPVVPAFPLVKCPEDSAVFLADYIRLNSGGMGVQVLGDNVMVYNAGWPSKAKQLAAPARIDAFVQKYEKLGDDLGPLLSYHALISRTANSTTVHKLMRAKLGAADIAARLKACLK